MTDVDESSIYSNHILDFIFEDRCVSVVDKTDFDYIPPIAALSKNFVPTKRHSKRLNRPMNNDCILGRENCTLHLDHFNCSKKMKLAPGEPSDPRRPGASGSTSATEVQSDPKINNAQCVVVLEQNIADDAVETETEVSKKKKSRRPKTVVYTPVGANKRKRSYKRRQLDRPEDIEYIPLGAKSEIGKNEVPKMHSDQQLKNISKDENTNLYLPVSNSKTPICVLKKRNYAKTSKPDNTDIIYSSSIRNIDGNHVPKIVLIKEQRSNKIVAIQNNDDTTELHIEEATNSNGNSNDNCKSDNNIGKHILPMRISERRSIAEPLRPQFATIVPNMNDQHAQMRNEIKTPNVRPAEVPFPRHVMNTSDDVPEDLSIKSTRSNRDQNMKQADAFPHRVTQVMFSSEKDRVLPSAPGPSRKYVDQAPLQPPQLQVPQQSPRQVSEPQQHLPIQKLCIHSPQQSPQQYLQSARHYPLHSHLPPQIKSYLQTPQHSPIIQQQNSSLQHSPIMQQQNSTLQHSPIQHSPIQHSPIQHSPIQHSPIQHSPIQHSPIQHSPLQHSPLQQIQNQFTNASVQQQRMQYMMQQHQAANMMGCQVPLGNPCQMRQQPQTMLQEQYAMQILMHQQYLNEQQRMVQQQQQIAEHLQQSRFSPQQQLLAQQTINRQNENNIITNRPADILRGYPFVPCSPYPQQIRKAPIISPGTQYSSDNSQDYWYNLANLNNMYSTTLQNETNIIPNKAAKKRNAKSAKIATKPVFEEPASKVKRSNTLADFAQDFVNSNANYRATPTNGVDTYNMHAVNNRATISISCPKNIPSAEGSKAAHYENHCTGRHRELFDNMPQQRLMSPHEENFHNIDILRDVRNRVNEFGEYLLNDSSGLTIRKVKANENCENLSVPPLSSASLYNAQNCHNSSTSASVSGRNIMLRTALSSNKSQLSRADVTTVSPSSLEDIIKSKMSPLICDPREMNQMKPKENIAEDIGPMVATFSNHNKRKIMEIRDRTSKRGRMDNNHHFIVQNNIASSGCTVINGVMAEAQTIESIKITTSETESNDFEISSKNIDSENSLIIDENCVVDLSIPQRKNSIATHSNVPEVEIPPANTTPTVADTIDNDYNEVQEMENGVSSHKRTMEDELTSLEEVLSNTHLIHNKTIPKLTEDNKNNNSSPSLSETAQELSFALSASSTGNNSEAVLEIDTEKDVVNENLSCVVQNEFDTENNDEIKNQSSEICDELGHQGSSTENTSEDLDTEKHAGIQIQVSEICGELGDQGTSTTNATEELDTGKDDGIENQVSEISGELDGQGANGSEQLNTENDVGIINQICANDDQSTPIANDSAVFAEELNTEDNGIQNQISKSSVKFDDQTNDSEVSVQELNAEEDMGTENQRGVNLDDPDSLTQDSEVLANELATEKDDVAEPVNSPTANDSEILSEGLNTETDDDIKTHISNPIAIEKNSTSEDIEVVVTVTEIENEETETSYAETNFEEMIFQENVISSETVEYAEQHNTIIEIYDDDDINENNLSKQNSALTNNGCELAVRTLEVTVNTPTREVPPQRLVGCYSVDSSDDSSDDEEDDPRSNYVKNKQFEVISISSDSESEPEYIDETIIDSRFRNDLRKKFRKKHFLKKVKKDSKEMTKTARNLRELINDCFHVYVGPNNNNLEGNVNDNFKSVKTVLPEFDQNIRPWQHNSKIFLKRCYDIQLYKFKMNIPEAIVCLKHMLRNISIYLVPLREAKFRFVLECKDLIEDYYMNKYFKTLYPPRMNGNMVIIRLDESDSDGSMEVVTISSQASNCGESVNQEMNVQDKKENGSSSIRNGVLAIKGSEENERNSDSNLEVESSDENESLPNDSENSEVSQTKDGSFSKPSNDDNVDTDERATPNLKRKLDDLEECNSDVQTVKDSCSEEANEECSEEAKTDDPDDLNKMETFEGDINNNESNISSKVLVENTDFHAENEQISENFPNGKHAKMRKRFHNKKCKEKSNEIDNCESFSDKENDIENENRVNEIKSADFNNFNNENEDSQRDQKVLHRLTSNKNIGDANVVQNTTWKKTSDASSQINSKNDETRKSPELSAAKTVVCLPEASEQLIQNLDLRNSDNSFEFFEDELRSCLENGTSKSLVRANNRNPSAAVVINRDGSSTSRNIFEDCKVFNIELSRSISIPKSLFQFNSMNLKDVYKENDKITILSKVVVEAKPKEILKKYLNSENRNSKKADQVELYKENVADMRDLHQNSGQEIVPKNAIICVKPSQNNLDVKNQQENPFKLPQTTGDRRESEEKKFQDPLPFPNAGTANYTTNTSKPQILASTKTVLPQQRPPNYYYQPFPQNIAQYGPNNQNYSNPHFKLPNLPILHQNAQSTSFPNCSAVQNHLEVPRKSELLAAPSHVNLTHARQNVTASYNKEPNLSNERRPPQPKKLNRCYPRTKMTTPSTLSENQYNYYHQQPPQSVPEPDAMATTSSSWHNAMEPNQNNQFPAQNHFSNIVAPFNRTQQTQNVVFQKMQFLLSILHRGDILSPEEYVREIQILQYHQCPRILLDFYTFITKSQIYVNVFPISFRLFLEYHYAGKLKELEVAFVRYVESHERERQLRLKKN